MSEILGNIARAARPHSLTSYRRFHVHLCEKWNAWKTKPTSNVCRAIFLPVSSKEPEFIWLKVQVTEDQGEEDESDLSEPEIEIVQPEGVPYTDPGEGSAILKFDGLIAGIPQFKHLVLGNMAHGQRVDHGIHLRYQDDFLIRGFPRHRCLNRMVGSSLADMYRGPLVFCGTTKVYGSRYAVDLDTRDLTLALNGLSMLTNGKRTGKGEDFVRKVKGVKTIANTSEFTKARIPTKHPIFFSGTISKISKTLSPVLPTLKLWQTPSSGELSQTTTDNSTLTTYLTLTVGTNPGSVLAKWERSKDSVLIAHTDRKDLRSEFGNTTSLVREACEFLRDTVQPSMLVEAWKKQGLSATDRASTSWEWEKMVEAWKRDVESRKCSDDESADGEGVKEDDIEEAGDNEEDEATKMKLVNMFRGMGIWFDG